MTRLSILSRAQGQTLHLINYVKVLIG